MWRLMFDKLIHIRCLYVVMFVFAVGTVCAQSPEIVQQKMTMQIPEGKTVFSEEMLQGEITDTKIEHLAYRGPVSKTIKMRTGNVDIFIFIKGNGQLTADSLSFNLVPESIAIPMRFSSVQIEVRAGEDLHFLHFAKKLSASDLKDLEGFSAKNKYEIYFAKFEDCEPYTEKIKSPNTISRTVLPEDIIPRVALGTVEAPGPDEVGAHIHAMLDQLFLGLTNNDIVVHADGASAQLKEYSLLHIPLGSSHWASVEKNKKMYYMWMDFFTTKEGQDWLKTHKPISTNKKDY